MAFFDIFGATQVNGTTKNYLDYVNPLWGPLPSKRTLSTTSSHVNITVSQDINQNELLRWYLLMDNQAGSVGSINYTLEYDYSETATGEDFSSLTTISINLTEGTPGFDSLFLSLLTLTLKSGSASHSSLGTISGSTKTWQLSDYSPTIPIDHITQAIFTIDASILPTPIIAAVTFGDLVSTLVCVARDTQILMADHSLKSIQDLQRGDLVAGDPECSTTHQVARIHKQVLRRGYPSNLVSFSKHCLGVGQPSQKFIVTRNHPIIWNGKRRPAYCFQKCRGVIYHQTTDVSKVLPPDCGSIAEDYSYTVYDLQFDHDGTYVANNIIVQSRSPYSEITPLPKELYFDQTLYTNE